MVDAVMGVITGGSSPVVSSMSGLGMGHNRRASRQSILDVGRDDGDGGDPGVLANVGRWVKGAAEKAAEIEGEVWKRVGVR